LKVKYHSIRIESVSIVIISSWPLSHIDLMAISFSTEMLTGWMALFKGC